MPKWLHRSLMIAMALLLATVVVTYLGYQLKWDWSGFIGGYSKVTIEKSGKETKITTELPQGKSLWDWLNLLGILAIPAAVGFGTIWFAGQQHKESEAENEDNQRKRDLHEYIDKISDLLLKEKLRDSVHRLFIDHQFVINVSDTKHDEEVKTVSGKDSFPGQPYELLELPLRKKNKKTAFIRLKPLGAMQEKSVNARNALHLMVHSCNLSPQMCICHGNLETPFLQA